MTLKTFNLVVTCLTLLLSRVAQSAVPPESIATPNGETFYLIGGDEFDGGSTTTAPDASRWTHEVRPGYNNEAQHYTTSLANSFVSNGELNVVSKKEKFGAYNYTSAFLTSKDLFCVQQNSYTTIRAKIPSGVGSWPALWLLGPYTTPWPYTGEIDIMEAVGFTANTVFTTVHSANTPAGVGISHSQPLSKAYDAYHNFDVYWNTSAIVFLLDGAVTFSVTSVTLGNDWNAAFSKDRCFQVIINNAVGGSWGGQKGIDDTIFPNTLLVDYVRVYSASKNDLFWNPVSKEQLDFQLNPCGGSSVVAAAAGFTHNASIQQLQRRNFAPFLKSITMGSTCNTEYIFVDDGGYVYVAPGGSSSFDIRAVVLPSAGPRLYQLQQKTGTAVAAVEGLQSYSGGLHASAGSCCIMVRPSPGVSTTAAPPPPVSTTKPVTTLKQTTQKPSTAKPTTAKPSTAKPTTAKPSTAKPTTAKPSTAKPTTAKPSTAKPTTAKPSTAKPSTAKPSTAAL